MARQRHHRRRRDWDSPWKETLQHFFRAVLALFFPDLHDDIDWSRAWGCRTGIRFRPAKLLDYVGREAELAASPNPVAAVALAHLEARATRDAPEDRRAAKVRLVKGLYDRGWSAADVRQLFRLIDWLMELPKALQEGFRQDLYVFEEERHMPYVTSIERMAEERGLREGAREGARAELLRTIRTGLKDKFGAPGARLMRKVRAVEELRRQRALARALIKAESLDDLRALLD
jgi:hypothetical protein